MSRRSASPDAETTSYWPPPPLAISDTISLDVPAYLALTWHPVACSNGFTHCGWAYPSQAMTLSWPSPLPTEVGTGVFACGAESPLVPPPPPLLAVLPPPPDEPQAATSTAAEAAARSAPPRAHTFIGCPLHCEPRGPGSRYVCRRFGSHARRRSRCVPGLRALRPPRSPGSGAPR